MREAPGRTSPPGRGTNRGRVALAALTSRTRYPLAKTHERDLPSDKLPAPTAKKVLRRGLGNRPHKVPADDAAEFERQKRRDRVGELRCLHKLTFRQIGAELGISHVQAKHDFDRWMEQTPSPLVAEVRAEEEPHLLDMLQENRITRRQILKSMVREPGTPPMPLSELLECAAAISNLERAAAKISESRRKLHGADAPEQKEHSGPGGGPIPIAQAAVTMSELAALMDENEKAEK